MRGICEWFHFRDDRSVISACKDLEDLGVKTLRTGISWADWHREGARDWYEWMLRTLNQSVSDILVSVYFTPPSISENGQTNGPPIDLTCFGREIKIMLDQYHQYIDALEIWNEPNNRYKWDFIRDPDWSKFSQMINPAAKEVKDAGLISVLGGMSPIDHVWLQTIECHGALENIDVIALHNFPRMWPSVFENGSRIHWCDWEALRRYIEPYTGGRPIWVTETGMTSFDHVSARCMKMDQVNAIKAAAASSFDRVYMFRLYDLHESTPCLEESFGEREWNEYYVGLMSAVSESGAERKPAYYALREILEKTG